MYTYILQLVFVVFYVPVLSSTVSTAWYRHLSMLTASGALGPIRHRCWVRLVTKKWLSFGPVLVTGCYSLVFDGKKIADISDCVPF